MLLNRERALGLMERFDLDALVATTPEDVTYLSDFVGWSQRTSPYVNEVYAVFFRDPALPPERSPGASSGGAGCRSNRPWW